MSQKPFFFKKIGFFDFDQRSKLVENNNKMKKKYTYAFYHFCPCVCVCVCVMKLSRRKENTFDKQNHRKSMLDFLKVCVLFKKNQANFPEIL